MKTRVHVNQHVIRANVKNGTELPSISVKTYRDNKTGNVVELRLPDGTPVGRFVARMHDPRSCGARVWFETDVLDVVVVE